MVENALLIPYMILRLCLLSLLTQVSDQRYVKQSVKPLAQTSCGDIKMVLSSLHLPIF